MIDPDRTRTILIYAAYPAIRAGLMTLLADDPTLEPIVPEPLGLPRDGPLSSRRLDQLEPAVVMVDLSGIDEAVLDEIRSAYPSVPQVLVGAGPSLDGSGLSRGAIAYLGPEVDGPMLIAAVRGVLAGLTVVDPVVAGSWLRQPSGPDLTDTLGTLIGGLDLLTEREHQVLELVAAGLPNKAIARDLGISEHTVKFHVGSLLGKLGAGSRTEAVTLATRRGLLTI